MIRVLARRIILPRGNTGSFTLPTLTRVKEGDLAVFSVYDSLNHRTVLEKTIQATNGTLTFDFKREDTIDLEPGKYSWDVTLYLGPKFDIDGYLIDGEEIHSYYSGFDLPVFELRETTEDLSINE